MSDNDLERPNSGLPDPGEEELSEEGYDEATVRMPEEEGDIAGDLVEGLDEQQATPMGEGSTDDGEVYVILPDGEGGDIPVVETEVVDEEIGLLDAATPAENLEDVPIRDSNPLFEATQVDGAAVEVADTENLDQLASELDDDLLGGTEPVFPQCSESEMFEEEDVFEPISDDEQGEGEGEFYGGVDDFSSSGGNRRLKVILPLAATLLLGVGGYFAYISYWQEGAQGGDTGGSVVASSGTHSGTPGGTSAVVPAGKDPAGGGTSVSGGPPDGGSDPDTGAVDPVVASREAFHEKFLLAIELGYGGSVTDE